MIFYRRRRSSRVAQQQPDFTPRRTTSTNRKNHRRKVSADRRRPVSGRHSSSRRPASSHFSTHTRPPSYAVPPESFFLTRAHFQIIKCYHHLDVLHRSIPPSLLKASTRLVEQLHPAFVSDSFRSAAKEISDQWLDQTLSLLDSHYQQVLLTAESVICDHAIPSHLLDTSLSLASSWAKTQLSRRLNDSSLQEALQRIRDLQLLEVSPPLQQPLNDDLPPPVQTVDVRSTTRVLDFPARAPSHDASTQTSPLVANLEPSVDRPSTPDPVPAPRATSEEDIFSTPIADAPLPDTSARQGNARKRPLEASQRTTQLDLFGEAISAAPSPRRRALTSAPVWKRRVVCGDANLSSFTHDECFVLAHDRGKLSHYKDYFRALSTPDTNVEAFVISLSLLDRSNCFLTNQTSLKAVLGAAGRLFPKAQRLVLLCGIPSELPTEEKTNIKELNNYVMLKAPSSCLHIPAPSPFEADVNTWSDGTRSRVFDSLRHFLN